ncbi:MAG TPA: CHAT domain-containing protein, partial [Pyrinomonadaceae bacterium]|nr:CHAT domain-containing protein [Pyrinomonadaceae bacterium]
RGDADTQARAYTLFDLADVYYSQSLRDSLPRYEEALEAFRQNNNRRGQALALSQIGLVHIRLNELEKARKVLEDALEIERSEGDTYEEMRLLNMMGGVYDNEGQSEKARELYMQARDGFHRLGDPAREGNTLINIGSNYDTWGEWEAAFANYQEALKQFAAAESLPESDKPYIKSKRASVFYNIGFLYVSLGDYAEGLNNLQKSLELRAQPEQGRTLMMIGYAYVLAGEPQKALEYCERAIGIKGATDPERGQTYTVMGMAQDALGEHEKAVEYFNKALEIQQKKESPDLKGQAITLDKRGGTYAALGKADKALEDLEGALSLWQKFKDRNGEAITRFQLARVERDRRNLNAALSHAEAAIKLVEPLRANVTSQQLRASYFASKVDYYELYIDLNMRARGAGDDAARTTIAFEASERARARGLLDILSDAGVEAGALTDPALAALVKKRRRLQRTTLIKSAQQSQLLRRKPSAEDTAALGRELAALSAEQERVEAQIRSQYPRYAALMSPQPLAAAEIQQLLDDDTLLLEFTLGEDKSYVWALTPKGIAGYELPPRVEIERAARRLKEFLRAGQPLPNETAAQRRSRRIEEEAAYWREATTLSRTLLGPVASHLQRKRLLVVADGELLYLPFGALPDPAAQPAADALAGAQAAPPVPLIQNHEVVSLPSASVLSSIRRVSGRKPAPEVVAVFADPIFEKNDMRIQIAGRGKEPSTVERAGDLRQAVRDTSDGDDKMNLQRLPSTEREARDILSFAPSGSSLGALGFQANRRNATDARLSQYRIVHFATHGMLNEKNPELSGIVLSLYDEQGRFHEEGFLRLSDIYELSLPVELVVLSACRTGLGKRVRGEGMIGLTRGFMYAGAARVVASLWKVDDAATAELMKRFYKAMLKDEMTPAAALRSAQVSMWEQPRWRSPYYWSGFVLQGEWR